MKDYKIPPTYTELELEVKRLQLLVASLEAQLGTEVRQAIQSVADSYIIASQQV